MFEKMKSMPIINVPWNSVLHPKETSSLYPTKWTVEKWKRNEQKGKEICIKGECTYRSPLAKTFRYSFLLEYISYQSLQFLQTSLWSIQVGQLLTWELRSVLLSKVFCPAHWPEGRKSSTRRHNVSKYSNWLQHIPSRVFQLPGDTHGRDS